MKTVVGWCLFFVGVAGLGYWAMEDHAKTIENRIAAAAKAVDLGGLPVKVDVSGRDITLSGDLQNEAQRTELVRRMARVEGVRLVHDKSLSAGTN